MASGQSRWLASGSYAQRNVTSLQMIGGALLSGSGAFSSLPVTGTYVGTKASTGALRGADGAPITQAPMNATTTQNFLSSSFEGVSGSVIQALNYLEAKVTSAAGVDTLGELSDVTLSGEADANVFLYEGGAVNKWKNQVLDGDASIDKDGSLTLAATNTNLTTLSSVTTVGALAAGSIASGFGTISTANDITTTKEFVIDADGSAIGAAGALTLGDGQDASIYWDATDLRIDTAAGADISFRQGGTELASLDEAGLDLAAGDDYKIGTTSVLNATTLGSGVVASSLTSVGTLTSGVWNAGAIDNGTSNITTGGKLVIDVDGSAINAAGAITLGAGNDASMYWDGGSLVLDTAAASDIAFEVAGTEVASLDADGLSLAAGDDYQIGGTSVLNATTLGSGVVASSLTSVGTIATGVWNGTSIAVANGGTGATTAGAARTSLGLVIGSDVQGFSANLAALDTLGIPASAGSFIVSSGAAAFGYQGASAARSTLGLGSMAVQAASSVAITGGTILASTVSGSSVSGLGVIAGGADLKSTPALDRAGVLACSGTMLRSSGVRIENGSTVSSGADYLGINSIPHLTLQGTDQDGKLNAFRVQISGGLLQVSGFPL